MEHHIVLPLRGEVRVVRLLTNGVQQFLMVIEVVRNRRILGFYGWGDGDIFVAEFLMGVNQVPRGIVAIHGVIREVGRALRRISAYLVVEQVDDGNCYILYAREHGEWVIDELLTEVTVVYGGPEVSDDEEDWHSA